MGKLKDKVVGKTKQAVAEIIGDGKLNEEGKEQARTIEPTNSEPPGKPRKFGQHRSCQRSVECDRSRPWP